MTARDAIRDLSDQQAEHADAMAAEAWDRDGWDEGPSAREIASADEWWSRYGWDTRGER